MKYLSSLPVALTFFAAAVVCFGFALFAARLVETRSVDGVNQILAAEGLSWVDVSGDGMQVIMHGTAENEVTRFRALSAASDVVDPSRIIDRMDVLEGADGSAPRFSIEILRNDGGISLIGLIPTEVDRTDIVQRIRDIADGSEVSDLLEIADYARPRGWDAALNFAIDALDALPRSKISIASDRVAVTAIADSPELKRRLENDLTARAPTSFTLALDISAPRPVITPFTLRMVDDGATARFDACSADTAEAREQILVAAIAAGLTGRATCTLGLGSPTPDWGNAVSLGIGTLDRIGGGTITYSDVDVTLVGLAATAPAVFERESAELESALPDIFTLHAVLPSVDASKLVEGLDDDADFIARRAADGAVQMRGKMSDELTQRATASFARARFGIDKVAASTRVDQSTPPGWTVRVLASLEALSLLNAGTVKVTPDFVDISGVTGSEDAQAEISRLLADKLGASATYRLDINYDEALDPVLAVPTPDECVSRINAVLGDNKIAFASGSPEIDSSAREILDRVAVLVAECDTVQMEIGGHTDSQGGEELNLGLSQSRAEAVLDALLARSVPTSALTARGYGESSPIASNESDAGREANRRIEFTLADGQSAGAEDGNEQN
jgi:OmpA-OmpF porin, OOP family